MHATTSLLATDVIQILNIYTDDKTDQCHICAVWLDKIRRCLIYHVHSLLMFKIARFSALRVYGKSAANVLNEGETQHAFNLEIID